MLMISKKKKKVYEELEQIEEMGQDSETKAAKSVIELSNKAEKDDKEETAKNLQKLEDKRKLPKIYSYKESLAIYMANLLKDENFPLNYHFVVEITDKGLRLGIWSENLSLKKVRQFEITGLSKYDLHAATMFAYWAGDIIYQHIRDKKTKSGIILPN